MPRVNHRSEIEPSNIPTSESNIGVIEKFHSESLKIKKLIDEIKIILPYFKEDINIKVNKILNLANYSTVINNVDKLLIIDRLVILKEKLSSIIEPKLADNFLNEFNTLIERVR